jgi:hypothetical protein
MAKKQTRTEILARLSIDRLERGCWVTVELERSRFAGGVSAVAAGALLCNPDITFFLYFFQAALVFGILCSLAGALHVTPVDMRARVADPIVITHGGAPELKINKLGVAGSGPLLPLMSISRVS